MARGSSRYGGDDLLAVVTADGRTISIEFSVAPLHLDDGPVR